MPTPYLNVMLTGLFACAMPISLFAGTLDSTLEHPYQLQAEEPPTEPPPLSENMPLCEDCSPIYVLCDVCDGEAIPVFQYYRVPEHLTPEERADPRNFHWYNGHFYTIHFGNPRVWYMNWDDAR